MRLARKLMLLAIMALAALAMSATSASAEGPVEVSSEVDNNQHCSTEILCETVAHSEEPTIIRAHLSTGPEVTTSTCTDEFHAVVETESGEGHIDNQVLTGGACPNQACADGTDPPRQWPFHMHESEGGIHEFDLEIRFCLEPIGGGDERFCDLEVGFNETEMNHQYEFEAEGDGDGQPCGPGSTPPPAGVDAIEVDGHWITEDENIEVEHAEVG